MAETIIMPKLGFDMAEGTLVRWVKQVGETINKGDVLAEIETDKATVEVESTAAGMVRKLLVDEGAVVPVNSPIAVVGSADEAITEPAPSGEGHPSGGKSPEKSAREEKPSGSAPLPAHSVLTISPDTPTIQAERAEEAAPAGSSLKASPLARKMARDSSLDLANIRGSGPGGRIVRKDIEIAMEGGKTTNHGRQTIVGRSVSVAGSQVSVIEETVPLSKLRQAIARRMGESKRSIPHFYVTHEYRVDALVQIREQLNRIVPETEKVSINDFIIKAAALTLRQFPNLNSSLDGNRVLHHDQVNIGVAVAVDGGLLTIVCREADSKPLRQISSEVKLMADRARKGKVKPEDIEGSTFSISNMGMYDVENFAAIINPPEAAILAVGTAKQVPVIEEGLVKAGWRMKATISVDHRISDGVEAARFMQALAVFIEEPLRLII